MSNIPANDPSLTSWANVPEGSGFSIQNLPFGIFSSNDVPRAGVAIGEDILDLALLHKEGFLEGLDLPENVFSQSYLNDFMGQGRLKARMVRNRVSALLQANNNELKDHAIRERALVLQSEAKMHMPVKVGNYTDFYSSEQHAFNVGCLFRDPENALFPNWKHIPVGYHGRASSIMVSGTDFHRPKGQTKADDADTPAFNPCRLLDFELETAFITCKENGLGNPVSTGEADDYIFGMVLFNDWSARDIQKWEYVPLGPFLAKNFASHASPWVVAIDALEPFRVAGPVQRPKVLPYLEYTGDKHIDIKLEVAVRPEGADEKVVCRSNYKHMYWNMNQQLAHHTVNGCNIEIGDMYGSGTISGPGEGAYGSMLEITWKGTRPVQMADGTERKFIRDGDTVIMRGHAENNGVRIGFGEVSAKVLPAL